MDKLVKIGMRYKNKIKSIADVAEVLGLHLQKHIDASHLFPSIW